MVSPPQVGASLARELSGLSPKTWAVVEQGFSREEIKREVSRYSNGWSAGAFLTPTELAQKILDAPVPLESLARQEILRKLLSERRITRVLPKLAFKKRMAGFFRRLDRAIEKGRLSFAHEAEREAIEGILKTSHRTNHLRTEVQHIASAYEAWLEASGAWDGIRLFREASKVLEECWPEKIDRPDKIVRFHLSTADPLERHFWDQVARHVHIESFTPLAPDQNKKSMHWESWHTLDDAAYSLASILSSRTDGLWSQDTVIFPEDPIVRRSLLSAFETYKIPISDPFDPSHAKLNEGLKRALLPLELAAGRFERDAVFSFFKGRSDFPGTLEKEILGRGIRTGLGSYRGIEPLFTELSDIAKRFSGRRTAMEWGLEHLCFLKDDAWVRDFLAKAWESLSNDLERIGEGSRQAPLRFWFERYKERLSQTLPPALRLCPSDGARLYRVEAVPVGPPPERVWIFGLDTKWLEASRSGDYWFRASERESLGPEMGVRSPTSERIERLTSLARWIAYPQSEVIFLDAQYAPDGSEHEGLQPILKELNALRISGVPETPISKGAHSAWLPSFGPPRSAPPTHVRLSPLADLELEATTLDTLSRCPFKALVRHRWDLEDLLQPGPEPWPHVRGRILHKAIEISLARGDRKGMQAREALKEAWKLTPLKGLLAGPRLELLAFERSARVLEQFFEKEVEYIERAQTKVISVESRESLTLNLPSGIRIIGRPDRIDEHPDGLFVIDYKTGTTVPTGRDILEMGYRLQLPFYALAAEERHGKPAIGAQFIILDKTGSRARGIYFKKWNGKALGMLTNSRSRPSVFECEPSQVWGSLLDQIESQAKSYVNGEYSALPRNENECDRCQAADLCGIKRR